MNRISIYKRKDGRYEGRVFIKKDENGKRKYKSFYGGSKNEVMAKYNDSFTSINSNQYTITDLTIKELSLEWLSVMSAHIKESTAANYKMKLNKHIIAAFGEMKCCDLKSKHLYSFIDRSLKSGLSSRYISDIIVIIKSIYKYAQREYNIKNVTEGMIMPKKEKAEVRLLSETEQQKLKKYLKENLDRTSLGIVLSLYMGLRIGELCALQWEDIDMKKRILTVNKTIQRVQSPIENKKTRLIITEPKSERSKREIPIPDNIIKMLKQFIGDRDDYVISENKKPIEPRTLQYRFAKILKNVNLPSVHFHSLRHLFATRAVALGFDIKTLSELLGHSSVELTLNRYVHSSFERKRSCMELMKWSA